jgi:hypothetical protein
MKLLKKLLMTFIVIVLLSKNNASAQSIELGAAINHLSNGFQLSGQQPIVKRWVVGGGLRVMVNTYSINENEQNYAYYQNGYAAHLWDHFGLVGRVQFRLLKVYRFTLNAQGNMLITWCGLKDRLYVYDFTVGEKIRDVTYTNPVLALETTIGLNLKCDVSKRVAINTAIGFGIMLSDHSFYNRSLTTGMHGKSVQLEHPNRIRGAMEYIGLDGLPTIYFGVAYRLK